MNYPDFIKKMLFKFTIFFFVFNFVLLYAQPRLEITPDEIEFEDIFHRNKNVYFINTSNAPLRIDSLVYKKYNYYFIRFNRPWEYPVFIQPNDSVKMDCILESQIYVPSADTSDTLFIFNNGNKPVEKLKIKIKFYDDDYDHGYIRGLITDGVNPIDSAQVHFLYENNYVIKSVYTNQEGLYNAELPPGHYAVAVKKDSFYLSFYQNQYDPFNADLITLREDSTITLDLQINRMTATGISISGFVSDSVSFAKVKKGVLVVRTGTHTPGKISSQLNSSILQNGIYTTFIERDGSYKIQNIQLPGYYFVQAFSDYYVPSFFTYLNKPAIFWQQADSLFVNGSLSNINVIMNRDSSVGGGRVNGSVSVNYESSNLKDVMIYAKSNENNLIYNYGFLKDSNEFRITNLPYGDYTLVAQKIGLNNGISAPLQITTTTPVLNNISISIIISSIGEQNILINDFKLEQNYPNPFNPETRIGFTIPALTFPPSRMEKVRLKVYDILGNEVATLVNEEKSAGFYEINFNASGLASGMYFYKLQAGNYSETKKMILLR